MASEIRRGVSGEAAQKTLVGRLGTLADTLGNVAATVDTIAGKVGVGSTREDSPSAVADDTIMGRVSAMETIAGALLNQAGAVNEAL